MGKLSDDYRAHLNAWATGDVEKAMSYIDDNIVWYPCRSMRPVYGKVAMRAFIDKWSKGMSDISYEQTMLVEHGNVLIAEGTEAYTKNGKKVLTHYAGIVEWKDGKAVAWRDYFDLKALEKQLAAE